MAKQESLTQSCIRRIVRFITLLTSCTSVIGSNILWFSASSTSERFKEEHLKDNNKIRNQILLKKEQARGALQKEL